LLSSTLVPVLAAWLLRGHREEENEKSFFHRLRQKYESVIARLMKVRWLVFACYLLIAFGLIFLVGRRLGTDIFPNIDTGLFQLRLRAPTGTRVERTEVIALKALDAIKAEAGAGNIDITLGYVGTQPASYPINTIHLWT
ncbi:MAG: efflux RND transporter permease subunit, partial [Acidobacteriota bacterium]|nr:efflux RND transporter permease subunit [Acidobacteriota bacterium]